MTTHCRSLLASPSSWPMVGIAVLTTEMSMTTRTCATSATIIGPQGRVSVWASASTAVPWCPCMGASGGEW